jgi:predicted transcriptional regulator of viral defense system
MLSETAAPRSLSASESRLVLDLEWRDQKTITLADLRALLGTSESYSRFLAHRLVRKGWLERLRPGLYRLIPASRGTEGIADTNPLTAGAVLVQPYFFSFGTACTHHGLTEQVFAETYIACQKRRPSVIVRDTRYVFVPVPREQFSGFAEAVVLGEAIQMAIPERALADALDRPRYAGGLTEVSRIVSRAGGKISWDAMLNLLARWNESALVQRLGYLLDLHGVAVPPDRRAALIALLRPSSKVVFGPRMRWGTEGKLVRPWNVIANVPEQQLVEKSQPARRRVSFGPPRSPGDR